MNDDRSTHQERLERNQHLAGRTSQSLKKDHDGDGTEGDCRAFGFLRGIRDRADAIEFRKIDGNSIWFPYGWLGTWKFNPSEGLLLKFSGDLVYLVLIKGSNLDMPLAETGINLTRAGLQRHRIVWVREMTKEEIQEMGETGPTVDSIEIGEFESNEELRVWVSERAPALLH
jgi:hypothetical protein